MREAARACFAVGLMGCPKHTPVQPAATQSTDPLERPEIRFADGAADYLARRSQKWVTERDCALSCHTTLPFAVAMSTSARLRTVGGTVVGEMTSRYVPRLMQWTSTTPWYDSTPTLASQSRGTESILNALAIRLGAQQQRQHLDLALAVMMSEQREDGGWDWLDADLAPWEGPGAELSGAALAVIALGDARGRYQPGTQRLRKFIARAEKAHPSLHEQLTILWAQKHDPDLLTTERANDIIERILAAQLHDGGWSSRDLSPAARHFTATSDASATAYVAFVLCQVAPSQANAESAITRALGWLSRTQQTDGAWPGRSMNSNAKFNAGLATDMATAYAFAAFEVCASPNADRPAAP